MCSICSLLSCQKYAANADIKKRKMQSINGWAGLRCRVSKVKRGISHVAHRYRTIV